MVQTVTGLPPPAGQLRRHTQGRPGAWSRAHTRTWGWGWVKGASTLPGPGLRQKAHPERRPPALSRPPRSHIASTRRATLCPSAGPAPCEPSGVETLAQPHHPPPRLHEHRLGAWAPAVRKAAHVSCPGECSVGSGHVRVAEVPGQGWPGTGGPGNGPDLGDPGVCLCSNCRAAPTGLRPGAYARPKVAPHLWVRVPGPQSTGGGRPAWTGLWLGLHGGRCPRTAPEGPEERSVRTLTVGRDLLSKTKGRLQRAAVSGIPQETRAERPGDGPGQERTEQTGLREQRKVGGRGAPRGTSTAGQPHVLPSCSPTPLPGAPALGPPGRTDLRGSGWWACLPWTWSVGGPCGAQVFPQTPQAFPRSSLRGEHPHMRPGTPTSAQSLEKQ